MHSHGVCDPGLLTSRPGSPFHKVHVTLCEHKASAEVPVVTFRTGIDEKKYNLPGSLNFAEQI